MRVDDVAVVLPANLRHLLRSINRTTPMLIGSRLRLPGTDMAYMSGGPGWVVSRPAVAAYLEQWCPPSNRWFRTGNYDITMHSCMVKHHGVAAVSPREDDGGHKFSMYGPARSFLGPYDRWFANYKAAADETPFTGASCCATYPISFHYVEWPEQRNIYGLMTDKGAWAAMSAEERLKRWNSGKICAYSSRIPSKNHSVWGMLFHKMRLHSEAR